MPKKQRSILIVDDDPIILKQLNKELTREFFQTFVADTGKKGLKVVKTQEVNIAIIDIKLPDMDGIDLLKAIKKIAPKCEVIVSTGFGNQDIAVKSLRYGAIDYLEKPIQSMALSAALGRAIEKLVGEEELSYENCILVVDDDKKALKFVGRFIEGFDYEVFTAISGDQGFEMLLNNKIDVVVSDIKMEGMDGIEFLKSAKILYPDVEVILITGFKEEELSIKALRAGAFDYLCKPLNLDELALSIQKAIERINLNRNKLYRKRELEISKEIVAKMNEELENRIQKRTQELNDVQGQLFQTSKLATLGEMSAGLAHEMNQPLGGISLVSKSFKKMLEKGILTDEEILDGLNDIDISVQRMSKIINHIRTFARQDNLPVSVVEVNNTITSAMSLMGEQLRLHEVTVELDFCDLLPNIEGEPFQLEQVWINIISNAKDSMEEKDKQKKNSPEKYSKCLKISTMDNVDNGVAIYFKDNGMGISKQDMEKIFQPFFTTKAVGKGMGLGMSISYGIIDAHQGSIRFDSKEGEGTTVRVDLPLKLQEV